MSRWFVLVVVGLSCSPARPTPYQPLQHSGGYSERRTGHASWIVRFNGNRFTSLEQTEAYALRRARELCRSVGFDDARVVDREQTGMQGAAMRQRPATSIIVECVRSGGPPGGAG